MATAVRPRLGLWDSVSIIVGIVIGSTIYKSPQIIMSKVSSPEWGLAAWALGGILSLIGALCYAELASTYPRSGGDYVYLSRAFGPWCGFLFGWAQLVVILTSSCAMLAFVFGEYAAQLWPAPPVIGSTELWAALLAAAAVAVLALTNILGVALGKWTQNLLSLLKIVGLGAIVVLGFKHGNETVVTGSFPPGPMAFGTAMILVLYAYGGWNDAAFVAADVRNRRNIIRALILGTGLVTVIYLAVNVAYLRVLGFDAMRRPDTVVAAAVGRIALQDRGAQAISILVMVSALGAINGLIFTGSRVYSTLGTEHSIFALLGRWSPRLGSPVWALLIHAAITLAMIGAVGTAVGRNGIDAVMEQIGLSPMPWEQYFGGFDTLLAGTTPVFWGFFLLSGLSLFALRQRDPNIERPFRVPLFPLLPLIFCGTCGYMLYSAIDWAKYIALIGAVPLALGLPLYWLSRPIAADGSKTA